ncbi:putative disease resistance protein RGA3 [Carex rostrata]
MAGYLITSLLSLITNLLPSITAYAQAPSSSSSNSNNCERGRARAVEEDLERLMRTLERIKATLYDAEEREIRDRAVKLWLKELKNVTYDAEDVLSEYQYEVTRFQVESRNASESSSSHKRKKMEYNEYIVSIPDGMVDRLKKIRSRFDEIAKDREALQLRESDGVRHPNNKLLRPPTGHMVDEASIFGRDAEIKEVIDFLLSEKEKPFSVISIIGKGGLGKTTIAQLVYKDERVTRCFDLFGWVCVSEEFDVGRLTKAIIETITKINYGLSELSSLQEKLAKTVKGKTIVLVLDDVWNENQSLWEFLRVPFKEAKLVRILVTTRNTKVADVMQTTTYFRPTNLPKDSCWQLFQHYASCGTSDTMPPHLVKMGREIMRKCGGLPLAVKSIASLLRHETDEGWKEILESDLWEIQESKEAIFPALEISYAHLPAHLKPCFLFCSMYPKDYLLKKKILIELWMSHGYIESRGKKGIREIGAEYYKGLKERSFLDDFSDRSSECCKLHDIIHDLARLKSENEHYSVDISQPLGIEERKILGEAYHVYACSVMGYVNQILPQNQGLRTLSTELSQYQKLSLWNLPKFEALRVLQWKELSLTGIPNSISELKHLAYLSITSDDLKMLPSSIGGLLNLKFLNIQSRDLLDYVPHGLVNFPAIKTMRANLRVKTIAWLKDMTDLEGNLSIYGVSNLKDAQRASLKNKCKLETLELCWDPLLYRFDYTEKSWLKLKLEPKACEDEWVGVDDEDFSLLDSLQPHSNIKKLQVFEYSSATLPGWMSDPSSLQSIQEISLDFFKNIQSLPFRNLHNLKHLRISACNSIRVLQLEQQPSQLEELHILLCMNLEFITGLGNLDKLATLEILSCPVLKSITMDGLQLVEPTEPNGDSSKENPLIGRQSISSLTKLEICSCSSLRVLPNGLIPKATLSFKLGMYHKSNQHSIG